MEKLESMEGFGVLLIAVALLAAFLLKLSAPPPDVVRAATSPTVLVALPEIQIGVSR